MGQLAIVTADRQRKNVTVSQVAAGAIVVGQTQLGVFIGSNVVGDKGLYLQALGGIHKCLNALRDSGAQAPGTATNFNKATAVVTTGATGVKDVGLALDAIDATVADENRVAIIIGALHQATPSASVTTSVNMGRDALEEQVLKPSGQAAA